MPAGFFLGFTGENASGACPRRRKLSSTDDGHAALFLIVLIRRDFVCRRWETLPMNAIEPQKRVTDCESNFDKVSSHLLNAR
jgi:hypothetical protein